MSNIEIQREQCGEICKTSHRPQISRNTYPELTGKENDNWNIKT
jgi:hypothetical protein